MTTVITRLFPDEKSAQGAVDRLAFRGIPSRDCDVFLAGADTDHLVQAMVHESAASTYLSSLKSGHALVVVRTTYKPLGAARLTREILAQRGGIETSGVTEDYFVPNTSYLNKTSILRGHPHLLTSPHEIKLRGPITPSFGMRLLKPHRTKRSVISGGRHMSRAFWPMKLISQKKRKKSVISGGRYVSQMFWPRPLLSNKPRRRSVIPGGGHPFSRLFGIRTIS